MKNWDIPVSESVRHFVCEANFIFLEMQIFRIRIKEITFLSIYCDLEGKKKIKQRTYMDSTIIFHP